MTPTLQSCFLSLKALPYHSRWAPPQPCKLTAHLTPSPPRPSLPWLSHYTTILISLRVSSRRLQLDLVLASLYALFQAQSRSTILGLLNESVSRNEHTIGRNPVTTYAACSLEIPHLHKEPATAKFLDRMKPKPHSHLKLSVGLRMGVTGTKGSGREQRVGTAVPRCSLEKVGKPLRSLQAPDAPVMPGRMGRGFVNNTLRTC